MALWCRDLPTVQVPRRQPKPVTIILPYYMNAGFLRTQIDGWRTFPAALRQHLSAIVVDDGSPVPATLPADLPFQIRLFRIEEDRRWNWLAARNIGAHHASEGWLLLTDMDHVLPVETADAVIHGLHDPAVVYAFARKEHTGEPVNPHSASFMMTRRMFWKIGGYDERAAGFYGSDGYFRKRVSDTATIHVLPEALIRHEYQGDSSTTAYKRKQPEDARLRSILGSLPKGTKPKTLSFKYHEVTA